MQEGYRLLFLAVIISFLGFITENVWLWITKGFIDNRNMVLPFLAGYGILVVGFYLLFGTPEEMRFDLSGHRPVGPELYFFLAFITVSLGEILLGTFAEKVLGVVYWDYSWIPFHLTRYTSLPTSLGFTCIIVFFMKHCFTPIMNRIALIPDTLLGPVAFFMFAVICMDTLHSFGIMRERHNLYCLWRIDMPHKIADPATLNQYLQNLNR